MDRYSPKRVNLFWLAFGEQQSTHSQPPAADSAKPMKKYRKGELAMLTE